MSSMPGSSVAGFWAVIPAGGAGTRLWPLSRAGFPKFLLDLTGTGQSLLQATVARLAPLADDRVLVVTGARHRESVLSQLPNLAADDIIGEPAPRDSMAAIGLAAAVLERRDPDAIIGSFAADHVIRETEAFQDVVRTAIDVAAAGKLVTIGIQPTHASTAFGYIRLGDALGASGAFDVESFVEKPSAEVASEYLATGRYRWNAGMFVVRASLLLDLLAQWHPELSAGLRAIAADPAQLETLWPELEKIPIDTAVAEPAAAAGHVAVVPGSFGWDDVGDFASLASVLPMAHSGPAVLGNKKDVLTLDSSGLIVAESGRTVTVIGLKDVVVVDTGDAVLVTTLEHAQDVKRLVDELKQDSGMNRLL